MSPVVMARLPGMVVTALGVSAAILARRLPHQSGFGLGPAFLPFWTGIVLVIGGLWLCLRPGREEEIPPVGLRAVGRAAFGFFLLLLYALALEALGYLMSTAGFLAAGILLLEPAGRARALLLGFAFAAFLLFVFRIWLRVPLPGGVLGW